ncbi:uncharacterized protein LOC112053246 [Bicyclus anynana]|uniref:Uncharacterized protein LOC112053246 n=1 Tax=Bicyclus anynana TaxID=110368 RepID=A0A6J1NY43_BICAN|nr:uncharacterized protein LOC112053246 [Bicyclus anynana]
MQLPEPPPPPLAPLWDRVLRARALPPDLDVQLLYVAIKDRLSHPEWEVRLHALRVLADLLPLSGNALSFPFDQVIDNLGHSSPNVRKAALDALKVFCVHCEDPECAARAIIDKFSYNNIRPHSAEMDSKINVITGLILSIPSVIGILRRRTADLDMFPIFQILGEKLFDSMHKDVALRSLMKLRRVCGPHKYTNVFSQLDIRIQDRFKHLCEAYDEDSLDVYYAPRKVRNQPLVHINRVFNNPLTPIYLSTDSSSEDSFRVPFNNNNYAKVIIETEIKFDSDTAITMTVLEQNETESDKNTISDEDCDSSDRLMLKYSEGDSEEDSDVVVKKVRFGGESVKIRTPDSDNLMTSEDDVNHNRPLGILEKSRIEQVLPETPAIVNKMNDLMREAQERESRTSRKSGIPLPVINNKTHKGVSKHTKVKVKSKSLSELYDYFNKKNDIPESKAREKSRFALTLMEVQNPDKIPSPVESHREVEVLHNLQRSPTLSPRRQQTRVIVDNDRFILNLVASSPPESMLLALRPSSPLQGHYAWEDLHVVPKHISDQLHNTENWIAAVKAADHLHSTLLDADNVHAVEPEVTSLVQHMWALSDAVSAARAPAEGAVCAVVRIGSGACVRRMLPALVRRMGREPPPAALPHALLQRMALHHLVELIFDTDIIGGSDKETENGQLRAALCLARAAGPAAVLAAVRRRLNGSPRADAFCNKLRERLTRPVDHVKPTPAPRNSHLPVATRRRARSTPPAAPPPRPRRLRPLPDSAPLPGVSPPGRDFVLKPRAAIHLINNRVTPDIIIGEEDKDKLEDDEKKVEELFTVAGTTETESKPDELSNDISLIRTPSLHAENISVESVNVEDLSEKSIRGEDFSDSGGVENVSEKNVSLASVETVAEQISMQSSNVASASSRQSYITPEEIKSATPKPVSAKSLSLSNLSKSPGKSIASSLRSEPASPEPTRDFESRSCERDVRTALVECMVPARHEDWEVIVNGLLETERLAKDEWARAPASSWRAVTRSVAGHVRSLRSRVARTACSTLGTLFEFRGRGLDPELEEAVSALLERCADVNRFLRADATAALGRVACGGNYARAGVALARRGASHRGGPVRAAAAQALTRLVQQHGVARILELPVEPRTVILRAAGELIADASPEARMHARHLYIAFSEDSRFRQLLKDAMPVSRYRAIEKYVDKLRCR